MENQKEERRDPIHLLTIGYVVALVIIAAMSVCIHVVIGQVIAEQNNAAIVLSARQAKLSQKIAFYAGEYAEEKDPLIREQLEDSIAIMAKSHVALTEGDAALKISSSRSQEIERIYFHIPYDLDTKMTEFLRRANEFLSLDEESISKQAPSYRYIVDTARGPLINALEAALSTYQAESEARIAKLQSYQKMALFVIFATLIAEAVLIFRPLVMRVHRYAERLKQLAMTDGLTGVDNLRSFMRKCTKELKSSKRHGKPMTVAILDLDHFKDINDKYGHLVGDHVLKTFSQFVQRSMRLEDEFARIGGEEFALLLPHTNLEGALVITDRIRNIIEISPVRCDDGRDIPITVSIGVAEVDPDATDFEVAMEAADQALYKAKREGRNCVVCSDLYSSAGNVVDLKSGKTSRSS